MLYILADATVKGFAFTLGLTTAIDVLIFILFTHPVLQLLARTRFFGSGHPLSGLDPTRSAPSTAAARSSARPSRVDGDRRPPQAVKSRGEAVRRQTIAERKQAELAAAADKLETRHDRQGGRRLMRSMSQVGNDLYTGKTSFPFVGRRRLWFLIAAILVIGSALVPLFRPIQFSIEFTGGSQFTVSGVADADQALATDAVHSVVPDATTKVVTIGTDTVRVQTDQMTDAESREVSAALAEAYDVPDRPRSATRSSAPAGAPTSRASRCGVSRSSSR